MAPADAKRGLTAHPVLIAQIAVAILLAIKIYLAAVMAPIGDEAYYWMWGQKLDWSYLDHPPLHSWLLGVMSHLFGWNLFALRGLTWLTLGGTLWIFWLWAKRLQPADPPAWFWPSAAIYLASPMFFLMSSIAFHDHLLILLCLASAHCLLQFSSSAETVVEASCICESSPFSRCCSRRSAARVSSCLRSCSIHLPACSIKSGKGASGCEVSANSAMAAASRCVCPATCSRKPSPSAANRWHCEWVCRSAVTWRSQASISRGERGSSSQAAHS